MQSKNLIIKHNLRALDGIHLSLLLSLKSLNPILVCSDQRLVNAAIKKKIGFINPEE